MADLAIEWMVGDGARLFVARTGAEDDVMPEYLIQVFASERREAKAFDALSERVAIEAGPSLAMILVRAHFADADANGFTYAWSVSSETLGVLAAAIDAQVESVK